VRDNSGGTAGVSAEVDAGLDWDHDAVRHTTNVRASWAYAIGHCCDLSGHCRVPGCSPSPASPDGSTGQGFGAPRCFSEQNGSTGCPPSERTA